LWLHQFHIEIKTSTPSYNDWAKSPLTHLLASKDKGFHKVDCTTDLSSLEPKDIARMVLNVNDNATNSFIQQIRRRLSIVERPLITARGDGKELTPVQHLGITEKVFDLKDIIYKR
jgi:hypothetical protein